MHMKYISMLELWKKGVKLKMDMKYTSMLELWKKGEKMKASNIK